MPEIVPAPEPETVLTREVFLKSETTREQVEEERRLRLRAGAIRSEITEEPDKFILVSEWRIVS